jgi:hypothetical protein
MPTILPLALALLAQGADPALRGTVRDEETGEPVPAALVELVPGGPRARADSAGRYALDGAPAGTHRMRVARLGYRDRELRITLPADGVLELDVTLAPLPARLASVRIDERARDRAAPIAVIAGAARIGSRALSERDVRADPLLVQPDFLLALAAGGDASADPESPTSLHVRGGAGDQTLVLIDGVPLYAPAHASGAFGAVNPDALREVELHAGVTPARLGGAVSGIVEMRTREPEPGAPRLRGGVGLTTARIAAEGSLGAGVRYLVSARHGAPSLLAGRAGSERLHGLADDFLVRLDGRVGGGTLQALAVSVADRAGFAALLPGDVGGPRRHDFEWGGASRALAWTRPVGAGALVARWWRADFEAEGRWEREDGPTAFVATRATDALHLAATLPLAGGVLRAGSEALRDRARYETSPAGDARRAWAGRLTSASAFVDDERPLGARWTSIVGLRATHVPGIAALLEPRLELRFRPRPSVELALGAARSHQTAQSLRNSESLVHAVTGAELPILAGTAGAPVARADQLAAALTLRPARGVRLALDAWSRRLDGLVLAAPATAGPFATDSFTTGTGRADGVAAGIGWTRDAITATLSASASRVVARTTEGVFHPAHAAARSLATGVAWRPSPRTTLRAAFFARAGRRATLVDGPLEWEGCKALEGGCEIAGTPVLGSGALGGERLPAYLRLDVGARRAWDVRIRGRTARLEGHITLGNVLDRRNVLAAVAGAPGSAPRATVMRPASVLDVGLDWRF